MQDRFLKGLYRFFSVTFFVSFLIYASGGCKIHKTHIDDQTTITSTYSSETQDICEEKQTTESDTDTTGLPVDDKKEPVIEIKK